MTKDLSIKKRAERGARLHERVFKQAKSQQLEIEREDLSSDDQMDMGEEDHSSYSVAHGSEGDNIHTEFDCSEDDPLPQDKEFFSRWNVNKENSLSESILRQLECDEEHQTPLKEEQQKLLDIYTKLAIFMSRYTSGKIPRALYILPLLQEWESLLVLTNPTKWTPHALCQATVIFSSTVSGHVVQRFYESVLLVRIRKEMKDHKRLNHHIYLAIRKSLYKPISFFKGIIFPLCENGCTLKEANAVASVIAKTSIPSEHIGAALIKLTKLRCYSPVHIFIRVLLDKKSSLPMMVINEVFAFFMKFLETDSPKQNVLWHQCLLIFVQRYKYSLSANQKQEILTLIKSHYHPEISEEVRREILLSSEDSELRAHSSTTECKSA